MVTAQRRGRRLVLDVVRVYINDEGHYAEYLEKLLETGAA